MIGGEILTLLPSTDTHAVVKHQVFVGQLAHHAGRFEERLERHKQHITHTHLCSLLIHLKKKKIYIYI